MNGVEIVNKRLKKKKENALSLVTVKNISGKKVHVYIKKKHWNKGNVSNGYMILNDSNNHITLDEVGKRGCNYIANFINITDCFIYFHKSLDNKNRIIATQI